MLLPRICFTAEIESHNHLGEKLNVVVNTRLNRNDLIMLLSSLGIEIDHFSPYYSTAKGKRRTYEIALPKAILTKEVELFTGIKLGEFKHEPHVTIFRTKPT